MDENGIRRQDIFVRPPKLDDMVMPPMEQIIPAQSAGDISGTGSAESDRAQLAELVDFSRMNDIFESFLEAMGIPAAIIDLEGKVLASSRWRRLCVDYHRKNPFTCKRCIESDTAIKAQTDLGMENAFYRCRNGLIDGASPIVLDRRHVANMFIGQFFVDPPDMQFFNELAETCGFEKEDYFRAISEVPIVAKDKVPFLLKMLTSFATLLGNMSVTQKRILSANKEAETAKAQLLANKYQLENQQKHLNMMNRIARIFLMFPGDEMYAEVLAVLLAYFESPHGTFGFISENSDLVIPSMTRDIFPQCNIFEKQVVFPPHTWKDSLWGKAIRDKKAYLSNREFQVPPGHIPVNSLLTVPVVYQDQTVGSFSVANREGGYDENHLRTGEQIAEYIAPILYGRIQKEKNERELKIYRVHLEQLVAERTESLKRAEEKSRLLLESAGDGIFGVDSEGKLNFINTSAEHMLGWTSAELIGKFVHDIIHYTRADGSLYPAHECPMCKTYQSGVVSHMDDEILWRKDGSFFNAEYTARPIRKDGNLIGAVITFLDITRRRKMEEELRQKAEEIQLRQERLTLTLEATNTGLWDWDIPSGRAYFSPTWYTMLGYQPDEFPSTYDCWKQLIHSEDAAETENNIIENIHRGKPFNVQFRMKTKTGDWRWILSRGRVVGSDADGSPVRMVGTHTDITENKKMEDDLTESITRYRNLTDHTRSVILEWDPMGNVVFLNKYGQEFFGFTEDEILGRNVVGTIVEPVDTTGYDLQKKMDHVQQNPDDYSSSENENICKDGRRVWVAWTNKGIRNKEGQLIKTLSIGIDRTMQKRGEEQLAEYRENLEKTNQRLQTAKEAAEAANRAKSEFLANMSHELRTPLNAINGFAQVMARSQSLPPEHQENVGIVKRSGEHLLTLINQVLELSKIEAGRTTINETDFDFHRMLDDLEDLFFLRVQEKNLQLMFERAPDVPRYIRSDEVKLRQILINLLNNAVKFTQQGGVALRVKSEDEGRILYFEIEDTGVGIAHEELENIFRAFVQTASGKYSQEGTGLGLAISQKFVQMMGGDITVHSDAGKGSKFRFHIQVETADASGIYETKPVQQVTALEPGQSVYRILIVDDKSDNRRLLVKLLAPLGFDIREAENGREAVSITESWEPHLIWMDMRMPVMDGYEATKKIKTTMKGQSVAIIAVTASAFEEERALVLSAGCNGFVRKPFREEEIFETMHKHLGVKYVYEEDDQANDQGQKTEDGNILTSESFSTVPKEWTVNLKQAILNVDQDQISVILEKIFDLNPAAGYTLKQYLENFEYDKILSVIDHLSEN